MVSPLLYCAYIYIHSKTEKFPPKYCPSKLQYHRSLSRVLLSVLCNIFLLWVSLSSCVLLSTVSWSWPVQHSCAPSGYCIPVFNLCDILWLSYYLFSPLFPLMTFLHFLLHFTLYTLCFYAFMLLYFSVFLHFWDSSGQATQFLSTSSLIAEAANPYSSYLLYSVVLILWSTSIICSTGHTSPLLLLIYHKAWFEE